jgi:hypothetical protein
LPQKGKSGIHNHRSADMDSGLLASLGPGMTGRENWYNNGRQRALRGERV